MRKYYTVSSGQAMVNSGQKIFGNAILGLVILVMVLFIVCNSMGSKFTCKTPKAGGKFTISLKSATDECPGIVVNIPAGKTAEEKAALIKDKINNSCAGAFKATVSGAEVTVKNDLHPGQKVFFKFGKDDTGEKDDIIAELEEGSYEDYYASVSPLFTCSMPASGVSVDGTVPGKIYIGTSAFIAEVQTVAGQTPFDILNNAMIQLVENGIGEVHVAEVSPGIWGLSFRVQPTDTFIEFGDDDTGTECTFEMFEPPVTQFHQLNFDYDGTITSDSEWGALDLSFIGTDNIMYLNLTVDTAWVIENIPVLSTKGAGFQQTQRFWFDIGDAGVPAGTIIYSMTLTPTIAGKPSYMSTATVSPDWVRIHSGFQGGVPGGGGPGPAGKQKGGQAIDPAPKLHKDFPNQESPFNYCVPTAVSNSLQWLNAKNGLGMKAGDISINSLAGAFGTTPANGTVRNTIYSNKKEYCKKKKLPITTRKFSGSRIADVVKEVKNGQDVELLVSWTGQGGKGHCVAVTGITDHGNGKYSLVITHDKEQDQPGGTVDENANYDKNTKKWGGALSNASGQSGDISYIVECPVVKSKQTTNHLPGGSNHKIVNDSRITFDGGKYQLMRFELSGYSSNTIPPPIFNSTVFSVFSQANMELSADSGLTFQPFFAPCLMFMRAYHSLDSGGTEYYSTEILQMAIQGGSLPDGFMLRESPLAADSSTGLLRLRPVPGGYQIDSFFDVFYQVSIDGGLSWVPDDNQTSVLHASGPAVLPFLVLNDIFIGNTQTICYDATENITVGGVGPFVVPPGGDVTMIAGHSIRFLEGTTAHAGGRLLGRITADGQYCPDPPPVPGENGPVETAVPESVPMDGQLSGVKVYPNPAHETITLTLTGDDPTGIVSFEIFDVNGLSVSCHYPAGARKYDFSASGMKAGVYFIRVITGNRSETLKLVKL